MRVTAEQLARIDLFCELPKANRIALAQMFRLEEYTGGSEILAQDVRPERIPFLLGGEARTAYSVPSGRTVTLRNHIPGEALGVFALAAGSARIPGTTASSSVVLASIGRKQFLEVLRSQQGVAMRLNWYLVDFLASVSLHLIEAGILNVPARVCAELLRMAGPAVQANAGIVLNMPTHSEFASRINTHREAVTRELKELERRSLISREDGEIVILDVAGMAALLSSGFGGELQGAD